MINILQCWATGVLVIHEEQGNPSEGSRYSSSLSHSDQGHPVQMSGKKTK